MSSAKSASSSSINRRQFLGNSARNAAQAAVGVVGLTQVSQLQARGAGTPETVRVGLVGFRNQGLVLAQCLADVPGCQLEALCEIDEAVLQAGLRKLQPAKSPAIYQDYRQLLDHRGLDAVVIATPDHQHAWMAALACASERAIYLEVPATHTLSEGEQLARITQNSQTLLQTGLQHRSGAHYLSAMEFLHGGGLGAVRYAKAWACVKRQPLKIPASSSVAAGEAQERFQRAWTGEQPPPALPPADWHFHWRWFWDYGSGELGAWGVPLLDLARWGLQVETPRRVSASGGLLHLRDGRETPDTLTVQYDFGDSLLVWEHRQWSPRGIENRPQGVAFYGERGTLILDPSGWKVYDHAQSLSQPASESQRAHVSNFIEAIRQREPLQAPLETGLLSTNLCHLGNLAYRQQADWQA